MNFLQLPFVIEADICVYRDYNLGVSFPVNPFVLALAKAEKYAVDQNSFLAEVANNLKIFFNSFQPKNVYEYLDIPPNLAPALSAASYWTAPHPWSSSTIEQDLYDMTRAIEFENKKWISLNSSHGCSWCGPVSNEKIMVEAARYVSLYNDIKLNGYKRHNGSDGEICVIALIDERGRWCFVLQSGAHRFAALCALGARVIPYKVTGIFYRKFVEQWPNVSNGLYSAEAAIRFFDRYMAGTPPFKMHSIANKDSLASQIQKKCNINPSANSSKPILDHKVAGDIYYGDAAKNYENARKKQPYWPAEDRYLRLTLARLPKGMKVLDVPMGTGRFMSFFMEREFSVYGLDSSLEMINVAHLAHPSEMKLVNSLQGLADKLPFKDNEFDLVVSFRFLSWIVSCETAIKCIKEIARVTKKYAILELCVNKDEFDRKILASETLWNRLTLASLEELLFQNGLRVLSSEEIIDLSDHPGLTGFLCEKIREN